VIKVRAEFYSVVKEIVDASVFELPLSKNATVNDLFERLKKKLSEAAGF